MNKLVIVSEDGKKAVFVQDEFSKLGIGTRASLWFDDISEEGWIKGKSHYFVAKEKGKEAIYYCGFDRVSEWFDRVREDGLVKGESLFYVAENNGKMAIFANDNPHEPVGGWFDWVSINGLVKGETDYFIAKKGDRYSIFNKKGQQLIGWVKIDKSDNVSFSLFEKAVKKEGYLERIFEIVKVLTMLRWRPDLKREAELWEEIMKKEDVENELKKAMRVQKKVKCKSLRPG